MDSRITLNSPVEVFFHKLRCREVVNTKIIGVIDCSGSMISVWNTLKTCWNNIVSENLGNVTSVLFSTIARIKGDGLIDRSDCGGMTNIESAFAALNEVLERHDPETNFTVVFISDGADNKMNTIRQRLNALSNPNPKTKINFICVGIRGCFPTFLAMDLRAKYHRGSTEVPSVFVINTIQEFEFTFNSVSTYLSMGKPIKLNSAVVAFPWSEEGMSECNSGQFVISNQEEIQTGEGPSKGRKAGKLRKDEIEVLFKAWTQELMIQSISRNVESEAKKTIVFMNEVVKAAENSKRTGKKMTVLEKLIAKRAKTDGHRIQSFIAEVKSLATGQRLANLSEEEAAARLAIGTKEGKYHNKAMELRGISPQDYKIYRNKFVELLENLNISQQTSQEPSVLSLQTFKEVLAEEGLAEAVKSSNQYEFIETFPLIGNAIKVRRSNASMISPFKIEVLSFSKINTVVDSVCLKEKGYEMDIGIGSGDSESVNCILPIFDEIDKDIKPILKSKLFALLMTYNCSMNADTLFHDAYYALLANAFVYILKEPNTEFRKETLRKIVFTTELAYGGAKFFEKGLTKLKKDPRRAAVTEDSEDNYKCETISKYVLNAFILRSRGEISDSELKNIAELAFIEHVGRSLKDNQDDAYILTKEKDPLNVNLGKFQDRDEKRSNYKPKPKNEQEDLEGVQELSDAEDQIELSLEEITSYVDFDLIHTCDTVTELKKTIREGIKEKQSAVMAEQDIRGTANIALLNRSMGTMNIAFFQNLFGEVGFTELTPETVYIAVYHAKVNTSSKDRCSEEIECDLKTVIEERLNKFVSTTINYCITKETEKIECKLVRMFAEKTEAAIAKLKSAGLDSSIFSKAAQIPDNQDQNKIIVVGPKSGKSTLIGKLLYEIGVVDKTEFSRYTKTFQEMKKTTELPFSWVANLDSQSRAKGETLCGETRFTTLKNKFTLIMDTPSRISGLKYSLDKCYFASSVIFCFNPDLIDYTNWRDQAKTLLAAIKMHKVPKIAVIFARIDMFPDFEAQSKLIMEDFVSSCKQLKIKANIPVGFCSVNSNINISKLNGIGENTAISLFSRGKNCSVGPDNSTETKVLIDRIVYVGDLNIIVCTVLSGSLQKGDKLYIEGKNREIVKVLRMEMNYNEVQIASKGQTVAVSFNQSEVEVFRKDVLKSIPFEENDTVTVTVRVKALKDKIIKRLACFYLCSGFYNTHFQVQSVFDLEEGNIECADKNQTVIVDLVPTVPDSLFYHDEEKPEVLLLDQHKKVIAKGTITKVK